MLFGTASLHAACPHRRNPLARARGGGDHRSPLHSRRQGIDGDALYVIVRETGSNALHANKLRASAGGMYGRCWSMSRLRRELGAGEMAALANRHAIRE